MTALVNKIWRLQPLWNNGHFMKSSAIRLCSSTTTDKDVTVTSTTTTTKKVKGPPELREKKWQLEFHQGKGKIAGKIPIKMRLVKGKMYKYCCCGHSHNQPLCDGTHHIDQARTKLRPIVFYAPDDMDVWLCSCKQTNNKPFCDGAHRSASVQDTYRP